MTQQAEPPKPEFPKVSPGWRSRLDAGPIRRQEAREAERWICCAVGEGLDLKRIPRTAKTISDTKHQHALDRAIRREYPGLHNVGCEFAQYMRNKQKAEACKAMDVIDEYVYDSGGPAEMRQAIHKAIWIDLGYPAPIFSYEDVRGGEPFE